MKAYFVTIFLFALVAMSSGRLFNEFAQQACTGTSYIATSTLSCEADGVMCVPGMDCVAGKCQTSRYYPSRVCSSSLDCYAGDSSAGLTIYCNNGVCTFIRRFEGDSCTSDAQCYSNNCTRNACAAKDLNQVCDDASTTRDFCKSGLICERQEDNVKRCVELNDRGEQCNTATNQRGCKSGLVCVNNVCERPVTRLGATCLENVAGHCAPSWDMYCKKNNTANTVTCAKYASIGEDCDTAQNARCYPDLTCNTETKKCEIPRIACSASTGCPNNQVCYCGGKDNSGNSIDGSCGTPAQRNCKYLYNRFTACINSKCNPGRVSIVADKQNCMQRSCNAEIVDYYDCVAKDVSDRGVSMPSIQGYNAASKTATMGCLFVAIAASLLLLV